MSRTAYDGFNVRAYTAAGELVNFTKIALDSMTVKDMADGVITHKYVDIKGKLSVYSETIVNWLLPLALIKGSLQDLPPIPFISWNVSPEGQLPLLIVLEKVHILGLTIPELERLKGKPIEIELPWAAVDGNINGMNLNRVTSKRGV